MRKNTMHCSSTELKQRLHIHNGESHERQFHGAWLTLGGFVREGWGCRGERQPVCSKKWIYLPDKLEWRCEIPAGGHTSDVCLFLGRRQRWRFTTIQVRMEEAGYWSWGRFEVNTVKDETWLWGDILCLQGESQHLLRLQQEFGVSLCACFIFLSVSLSNCLMSTCLCTCLPQQWGASSLV